MLREATIYSENLSPRDSEWLHLLLGDWQIIADAAHGDLVLWLPQSIEPPHQFMSVAQVRPSTVHTLFHRDMVNKTMYEDLVPHAEQAWSQKTVKKFSHILPETGTRTNTCMVPLMREERVIALLTVHTELFDARIPPKVELMCQKFSMDLLQMVTRGAWPEFTAPVGSSRGNPRVSDGVITLDAEGKVLFASPNAASTYKRLGLKEELEDTRLVDKTRELIPCGEKADETLPLVLTGRMPWRGEVRANNTSVTFRAIPLRRPTALGEERYGAVLLCRDVTELRRRELEMMTKDATIREIHHRVKNNLQTVSALLRLQSRRMHTEEAKQGLEEAMRRVATIALVHETLSQGLTQSVDFDELIQRQFRFAAELASPGQEVRTVLEGSFGELPSQFATPLALIINEIVANAVEHGLAGQAGTVILRGERGHNKAHEDTLRITITDDGVGMGDTSIPASDNAGSLTISNDEGLGMQIVRTLVASELNGSIRWRPAEPQGTEVVIDAVLVDTGE
ncbi:sensor histidine kinase [Rothia sp. P7181]|uniref:sensor histidine kinase n=1 Tax=unclassified Rothia (in: high G+C Gram-positive bacteria) TaxID=2689056 RepID=UPI003ACB0A55